MKNTFEAHLSAVEKKFGIVVSRFNEFISSKLLNGALSCLKKHQCHENNIDIVWVPGAFEIPLLAKRMAQTGRYDSIICLGTIIRGQTPHFNYVSAEVSKGIGTVSLETGIPVIFGVITTDNLEQAIERAGAKSGNKGEDAAMAAIEMANLLEEFK